MSETTATSSQTRQANPRRGRGRGGRNQGGQRRKNTPKAAPADADVATDATGETSTDVQNAEDVDTCWICAEPVKYYSVSECNHRTCHVCALRLRALYKRMDCTFCKVGNDYPTKIAYIHRYLPAFTSNLDLHFIARQGI
jgi:hypothetical protein